MSVGSLTLFLYKPCILFHAGKSAGLVGTVNRLIYRQVGPLLKKNGLRKLELIIKERRLRWLRHVLMEDSRIYLVRLYSGN